ncbi:MAG: NAD(+)/NADH kinase [Nannocystaceae bacterium]
MLPQTTIPPISRVLMFPREDGGAFGQVAQAAGWLVGHGLEAAVPQALFDRAHDALPANCKSIDMADLPSAGLDLIVALGGDGTLLRAARWAADAGLPVMGINLGDLGFLSAFRRDQLEEGLRQAAEGLLHWEPRLRMRVKVVRGGKTLVTETACNDAYVKHGDIPRLLQLATTVGGELMATYRADGIIVCTPMGSTAYNLAAGGPIVDPGTEVLTITPLCPHSLTHRPVVVASNDTIEIAYAGPSDISAAFLTVDGQQITELKLGDIVSIDCDVLPLKLVSPANNVFRVLAAKLGWSRPR